MYAGAVPIYYGTPNIGTKVPENTYIDFRKFKNYQDLYDFISSMPDDVYQTYLNNITRFLNSPQMENMTAHNQMNDIAKQIITSLKERQLFTSPFE